MGRAWIPRWSWTRIRNFRSGFWKAPRLNHVRFRPRSSRGRGSRAAVPVCRSDSAHGTWTIGLDGQATGRVRRSIVTRQARGRGAPGRFSSDGFLERSATLNRGRSGNSWIEVGRRRRFGRRRTPPRPFRSRLRRGVRMPIAAGPSLGPPLISSPAPSLPRQVDRAARSATLHIVTGTATILVFPTVTRSFWSPPPLSSRSVPGPRCRSPPARVSKRSPLRARTRGDRTVWI